MNTWPLPYVRKARRIPRLLVEQRCGFPCHRAEDTVQLPFLLYGERTLPFRALRRIRYVQIVMEQLGGGGHQTVAGAQFGTDGNIEDITKAVVANVRKQTEEEKE